MKKIEEKKVKIYSKAVEDVVKISKDRGYNSFDEEFWKDEFIGIIYLIIDLNKSLKEEKRRVSLYVLSREQEVRRIIKNLEDLTNFSLKNDKT